MTKRWKSHQEIANILGVSRQRVTFKLRNFEGRRNEQGQVDVDEALQFIEATTDQRKRRTRHTPEFLEAQARKEVALAELKEMELEEKAGKLVAVDACRNLFFKIGRQIRDAILAQENRMPGVLEGKTQREIKALLHKENVKILHVLDEVPL